MRHVIIRCRQKLTACYISVMRMFAQEMCLVVGLPSETTTIWSLKFRMYLLYAAKLCTPGKVTSNQRLYSRIWKIRDNIFKKKSTACLKIFLELLFPLYKTRGKGELIWLCYYIAIYTTLTFPYRKRILLQ
jgi:hypothetical protein